MRTYHKNKDRQTPNVPSWSAILLEAVSKPGLVLEAYSAFYSYSLGNQLLALVQCHMRGLKAGPIKTFTGWQAIGRNVKRGERAIVLCMPITCKRRDAAANDETCGDTFTAFVYKSRWFVLSQTEGEEMPQLSIPEYDPERALAALHIERIEFEIMNGNCQGYARKRRISINPVAQLPHKTFFHETAHLCCLRSYVALLIQVVWNELSPVSVPHITFCLDSVSRCSLVVAFLCSISRTIEE
jgi:hypothetical protein